MKNQKSTGINRRSFLKSGAVAVVALAAIGAGAGMIRKVNGSDLRRQNILRPPGAVDEKDFIYGCIKCGLCVQICPVQAVKLAGISQVFSYGTPYIDVRNQPCDFSCDSLQCVETCPTGVLDFKQFKKIGEESITEYEKEHDRSEPGFNPFKVQIVAMKEAVRMGFAKVNTDTCLAVRGEGFSGNPRGEDFKGVHRSPGRGQDYGVGQGRGRGSGRHKHQDGDGDRHQDKGRGRENAETKALPLRERYYDREICNLCVTECPIGCHAIEMLETTRADGSVSYIPQVNEGCTGCGVCVMVCPTENPSIVVEPPEGGAHA
ncbi:MAG: 4Fe-4S dicluster domain-containing protein [Bacteroidales bacterium]